MGFLDIVKVVYEGYKAGTSGNDLYGFSMSIAGLEVANAQIEQNQTSYINNKSDANTKAVKTNITRIRDYLRNIDSGPPSPTDMFSQESMANYQVSTAIANYASELLFKIDMAINAGDLPEIDDRPWSSRRGGYIRLRDGSRVMALQFEGVVRNKQKELTNITAYEANLLAIAFGKDVTDADSQWLKTEMSKQLSDENSTRRTLTMFALLANGARKNYEHFNALIDAGDRKNAKR